jgi:hypothetical protein
MSPTISIVVPVLLGHHHTMRARSLGFPYNKPHCARLWGDICVEMESVCQFQPKQDKLVSPAIPVAVRVRPLHHVAVRIVSFSDHKPHGAWLRVGEGIEVKFVVPTWALEGSATLFTRPIHRCVGLSNDNSVLIRSVVFANAVSCRHTV